MAIKKVTVLYGGESSERSVSLESGKYVFQSVKNLGYEAELIDYPIPANDDGVKSVQFILDNFKKVLISSDDSSSDKSTKNE